jgi:hypothetical protein
MGRWIEHDIRMDRNETTDDSRRMERSHDRVQRSVVFVVLTLLVSGSEALAKVFHEEFAAMLGPLPP